MKHTIMLSALMLLATAQFSFKNISECDNLNTMLESDKIQYQTLNSFDFNFRESFETLSVRGIQKANYYSCNGKVGYLLIYQHDRAQLFKDFPIDQWFEFKHASSPESYFSSQIKYNYVLI